MNGIKYIMAIAVINCFSVSLYRWYNTNKYLMSDW